MISKQMTAKILLMIFFLVSFHHAAGSLSDGYILFGTLDGKTTILMDKNGNAAYTWTHESKNGYAVYLLDNGNLLRTAVVDGNVRYPSGAMPVQGIIEEVDKESNILWTYQLANDTFITHHDMKPLPNGNILACAFEQFTKEELAEYNLDTTLLSGGGGGFGGMNNKTLLLEMIFELDPDAEGGPAIVWEWHINDHIVPKEQATEHPELFSGGLGPIALGQWVHLNGIDYNPKTDLIVFTSRILSEVYVIDHSTTTTEAAGHTGGNHGKGGDILYRWGRPCNYIDGGDTIITTLHCPTWIPEGFPGEGNILFFHNNSSSSMPGRNESVSQVIEIAPPRDANGKFLHTQGTAFGPPQPTWKYAPEDSMFSWYMSSTFRLKNGNTLVHECQNARFREVTPDQQIVWTHNLVADSTTEPGGMMMLMTAGPAKITYYPSDHPGILALLDASRIDDEKKYRKNIVHQSLVSEISFRNGNLLFSNVAGSTIALFTLQGKQVTSIHARNDHLLLPVGTLSAGTYFVKITGIKGMATKKSSIVIH